DMCRRQPIGGINSEKAVASKIIEDVRRDLTGLVPVSGRQSTAVHEDHNREIVCTLGLVYVGLLPRIGAISFIGRNDHTSLWSSSEQWRKQFKRFRAVLPDVALVQRVDFRQSFLNVLRQV